MIESIRNSGAQLDQPLQDSAQPVAKGGKATASGISSLQSTVPPSTASAPRNVASTFAPTSAVPAAEYDGAVDAAASRFSAAASALNPAVVPDGDAGLALSPLDAARALFKAVLQSNDHQQDDALQKRKEAMEAARSQQLAQAATNKTAAKEIESNSTWQLATSLVGSATTMVSAYWSSESGQRAFGKGLSDALAAGSAKIGSETQANAKYREAEGQIAAADAELANTHKADANDLTERLRQQFQQLFQAMSEMRAEKANQLRALV
ncbi:hypothetical protein [Bradyrhizobium sp. TM239]|uniref:hypothetical protein n=1 Tax=Bradyrhizobium sp. TM239 TaxID=2599802 RepID=UPI0027D593CA|nr:hypothetical protein TM239_65150 [Bradyrhizobium sp. TM239]